MIKAPDTFKLIVRSNKVLDELLKIFVNHRIEMHTARPLIEPYDRMTITVTTFLTPELQTELFAIGLKIER